jgi:hypothetical protein
MSAVLRDAEAVVNGPRQEQYGDPVETCERIGMAWAGILGLPGVSAREVALMMAALKLVREANETSHYDNLVDAAGYVAIAQLAAEQEQDEEDQEDLEQALEEAAEIAAHLRTEADERAELEEPCPFLPVKKFPALPTAKVKTYDASMWGPLSASAADACPSLPISSDVAQDLERAKERVVENLHELDDACLACPAAEGMACCMRGTDDRAADLCDEDREIAARLEALSDVPEANPVRDRDGMALQVGDFVNILKADFNPALEGKIGHILELHAGSMFGDMLKVKLTGADAEVVRANPDGHVFIAPRDVEGLPF